MTCCRVSCHRPATLLRVSLHSELPPAGGSSDMSSRLRSLSRLLCSRARGYATRRGAPSGAWCYTGAAALRASLRRCGDAALTCVFFLSPSSPAKPENTAAPSVSFSVAPVQAKLDAALDALQRELGKLRTGRATAGSLDHLVVPVQGKATPLPQLASVVVRDAATLTLSVYDEAAVPAVEAALRASSLGLAPKVADNGILTVSLPPPDADARAKLVKVAGEAAEAARAAGRRARAAALDEVKRLKASVAKDEASRWEKAVQEASDAFGTRVGALLKAKEKELKG